MSKDNSIENYRPTIGLEIHAELKTKTKMFCNSINNPDEERPNVNVCPVCMGHPGTLPVLNKTAIKHVIKMGYAIGSQIADFTEWDRKNYFYPDIPKGYQISQYKYPLITGGMVKDVEITRIHLEEDTASSIHDQGDYSLVNFNRAGVPLMELVTEPVIHSAKQAGDFARELQLILRYLDISEANMEKGEMRVEANISVAKKNAKEFGTKVEVKNLNSFKVVEKAIEFEIERQIKALENGEEIIQETRGWDEKKQKTFSQRKKETSDDYRYFPEPDLPKLKISEIPEFSKENIEKEIPELPQGKRERLGKLDLNEDQIDFFVNDFSFSKLLDECINNLKDKNKIKLSANYISSDLAALYKELGDSIFEKINSEGICNIVNMISASELSSRGAKDVLAIYAREGGVPNEIAEKNNLIQKSNKDEIEKMVQEIITNNPKVVEEYKAGKEASLQFLVGQGMRLSKGSANPQMLKEILLELLK